MEGKGEGDKERRRGRGQCSWHLPVWCTVAALQNSRHDLWLHCRPQAQPQWTHDYIHLLCQLQYKLQVLLICHHILTVVVILNMDTSTPLVCPPLPALNLNVELTGVSRECTAGLTNGSSGSRDRGGSGSSSNRGYIQWLKQVMQSKFGKWLLQDFCFLAQTQYFA